ncbi:MAG: DUF935 domain-containing protein [Parvibaculaceae bacterium]|nr:DUF935 domain-containing protein [Parvibaculaceae bacterium]
MAQLLDHLGRPVSTAMLKQEQAPPQTTGVRQVVSGHPAQGLTPRRLAGILRDAENGDATRYFELAEEMEEKDLHYLAVLNSRKRAVAQLDITIEAASDDKLDQENADFARGWLDRDELEDDLFDILDGIGKGFSFTEIIWDMSERQWWPARLEWRDQRWFELDKEDGRTPLVRGIGTAEPLLPFKFIHHVHRAKSGLPIRSGLARIVAWVYMFKNYGVRDWVSFAEIYGMPFRIGKYDASATEDDVRVLRRAVAGMSVDAAAVIPKSMEIEFVGGGSSGSGSSGDGSLFGKLAAYFDQQVSKAVLGQTTTTDAISGGHAVSKEHDEVRREIVRSDAKQLAATLNRDLIRPLIDLNRGPQKQYPKLRIGLREATDITALSGALSHLVPLGLKVEQSVIRDKLGLPDPEDGADLLTPRERETVMGPPAAQVSLNKEQLRDPVARLTDAVQSDADKAAGASVERLRGILDECSSLDEFRDRMMREFASLPVNAFAAVMRDGMVLAELTGRDDIAGE